MAYVNRRVKEFTPSPRELVNYRGRRIHLNGKRIEVISNNGEESQRLLKILDDAKKLQGWTYSLSTMRTPSSFATDRFNDYPQRGQQ